MSQGGGGRRQRHRGPELHDSAISGNLRCVSDPRWTLLEDTRHGLLDAFGESGVDRIEYTAAFPHVDTFEVWLCTRSDEQRDALARSGAVAPKVHEVFERVGFTPAQLNGLSIQVQSQETVDRDYERSWFYATR